MSFRLRNLIAALCVSIVIWVLIFQGAYAFYSLLLRQ